jgi:branched-chain amino acid transport system substrate-binding protein
MSQRWNKAVSILSVGALAMAVVPLAMGTATSSASSKPTFVIGVQGPFSGADAEYGNYDFGGAELAANTANASGKDPFTIKIEKFDDQGSPTLSPAAAQKAVGTSNLVAVIGPAFSGASESAAKYYKSAQVAEVSPSATAVALASGMDSNFFRDVADDSVQGSADAKFLVTTKKVKSLLVIADGSFYGTGLAAVVAADAKKLGATVTTETIDAVNNGGSGVATEYPTDATQIAGKDPSAIFYGGYDADFGLLLGALASAGYSASKHDIMSGDGSNVSALYSTDTTPKTAANGVYLSESASGKVSYFTGALAKAYKSLTHIKASTAIYAAQAYDGTNAIIKSLLKLKTSSSVSKLRSGIIAQLHLVSFTGVTGPISFQPDGDLKNDTGAVQVSEVKSGVIKLIATVG